MRRTTAAEKDTIVDFAIGQDLLVVDAPVFTAQVGPGALQPGEFSLGSPETTAHQHFIINAGTGALSYDADADGNGSQAVRVIASLQAHWAIREMDTLVI